jgi:hypothetical protein
VNDSTRRQLREAAKHLSEYQLAFRIRLYKFGWGRPSGWGRPEHLRIYEEELASRSNPSCWIFNEEDIETAKKMGVIL